jgi:hypothetical protein
MLGLITYSLVLAVLLIGAWLRPAAAIAAVLCLFGLKQWGQSSTQILSEHRQFTNFVVAGIAVLGVVRAAARRSCIFCEVSSTDVLVALLFGYALISTIWTPDPGASIDQWRDQAPYLIIVSLLAPLLFRDLDDTRVAFLWTAFAASAICVLALVLGKWGGRGLLLYGGLTNEDDNFLETNPLALAGMAGTAFLIAAMSLGRPNPVLLRLIAATCIPMALAVILRSGSRGQLIASGLGLLVALPIAFRPKEGGSRIGLVVAAALVLGLAYGAMALVDVDKGRWSTDLASQDVGGRFDMARALLAASTSSVLTTIFGVGNSSSFQLVGFYPHIAGLEVLAEEGLLGAAMYCGILFLSFRSIKRLATLRSLTDSQRNALAIIAGLFVFELVLSWKQGSLLGSIYVFAYAMILARMEATTLTSTGLAQPSVLPPTIRFENLLR